MKRFLTVSMFLCLTRHCLECFDSSRSENVALNKTCSLSSKWDETVKPGNAVNGDTSGIFNSENCIHTAKSDRDAWWEVDLGRTYPVQSITIWARNSGEYRMKGCVVSVHKQHCFTFTEAPTERKLEINCSSGILSGSTVRISKNTVGQNVFERDEYDHTINICEVEVFSCRSAFWGKLCENTCGECVNNSTCDMISGHCSCKPGFLPPLCIMTSCDSGTYGENCNKSCGSGCKNSVCNATSGHCECLPGWKPPLCPLACDSGTYGENCSKSCGSGCKNSVCNATSGHCECLPGWKPPLCHLVVPPIGFISEVSKMKRS